MASHIKKEKQKPTECRLEGAMTPAWIYSAVIIAIADSVIYSSQKWLFPAPLSRGYSEYIYFDLKCWSIPEPIAMIKEKMKIYYVFVQPTNIQKSSSIFILENADHNCCRIINRISTIH